GSRRRSTSIRGSATCSRPTRVTSTPSCAATRCWTTTAATCARSCTSRLRTCGGTRWAGPASCSSSDSFSSTAPRRGTAVADAVKDKLEMPDATDDSAPRVAIDPSREPIVVVDDLHVVYRVYGAGGKGNAASAFVRILRRENRP